MNRGCARARLCGLVAASWLVGALAADDGIDAKVEYLLTQVGQSGCTFIRNGKDHSAEDAEDHLRMKYRKGRRWVDSPEQFIERIASESSWSGDPYRIRCTSDGAPELTGEWLRRLLAQHRQPPG